MQNPSLIGNNQNTCVKAVECGSKRVEFDLFRVEDVADRHSATDVRDEHSHDCQFRASEPATARVSVGAENSEAPRLAQHHGLHHF